QTQSLSLRYYTIIVEASPFTADQPRLRARATVGQNVFSRYARFVDEWPKGQNGQAIPYSAFRNRKSVDGPFHTNSYFRIDPEDGYFNPALNATTSSFDELTHAGVPSNDPNNIESYDYANCNMNDWIDGVGYVEGNYKGNNPNGVPWDSFGDPKANAYEKLTDGRGNLKQVDYKSLPSTTADLQKAAWGFGTPNPVAGPDGRDQALFVSVDGSTGNANGGIYIQGDTRETILGVANSTGAINTTSTSASGNPAVQIEMDDAISNVPVNPPIVSVSTRTSNQTVTNYVTNTVTNTSYTPTSSRQTTQVQTQYQTSVSTRLQVNTQTQYTTSQSTYVCGTIQGGGFGQGQPRYCTTTITTGSRLVQVTQTIRTTVTTGTNRVTNTVWVTQYATNITTSTQVRPTTSVTRVTNTVTNTITQTTYTPKDVVYDLTDTGMTVGTVMNIGGVNKTVVQNGVPIGGAQNFGTGNIVVLKESASNYQQVELTVIPGKLNGVVYSEDNINNLHGVNKGRRTIAADIGQAGRDNGKRVQIGNPNDGQRADILQWGTTPGQEPTSGANGLGIVAHWVGTEIRRQDQRNLYRQNNPLKVYAVILAGRSGNETSLTNPNENPNVTEARKGGFRVFNLTQDGPYESRLRPQDYGYMSLFGGLIERKGADNYTVQNNELLGWDPAFTFDQWMAQMPPPFFPVTNDFTPAAYMEEFVGVTYQK
ncbi:MAG: hypothetical protein AB1758_12990, partial [Candidatus Eremiobacterota bacterium]